MFNQLTLSTFFLREQLREQHELTQEIGNAITSMPITEPIDEDELEAELATLEQEKLDEDMLKTGTMPVMSPLNGLPNGPTGDSKSSDPVCSCLLPLSSSLPLHLPYHFFHPFTVPSRKGFRANMFFFFSLSLLQ